jgi:hypothetical protein
VIFPCTCSNIPPAPAYVVYISQLIRYSRACGYHHGFHQSGLQLPRKQLNQMLLVVKLKSSLRYFCSHHHDLVTRFIIFCHKWLINGFVTRLTLQVPLVEQELLTLPEHLNSHTVVNGVHVAQYLVFCVVSWESFLSIWPLYCLSFFDYRLLITRLVSSNFS